jgi:hypothetical protein
MRGFEVRRGEVTLAVPDADALRDLVTSGGLHADDHVREPGGDWQPAAGHPALAGAFAGTPPSGAPSAPEAGADPWAAWSNVDAVDAATLYREMTDAVEDLPAEALAPVRAPGLVIRSRAGDGLEALPVDALSDADEDGPGATPAAEPRRGPTPSMSEPTARADAERAPKAPSPPPMMPGLATGRAPARGSDPSDLLRRARSAQSTAGASSGARAARSVGMVVATALLAFAGVSFLRGGSTTAPSGPAQSAPAPAAPSAEELRKRTLLQTEAELRGRLPPVPRPIKEPGALGDALMLEMTQLGVGVSTVDARVVKWVGRKQDEPKTVEVRVAFRPSADPSRDLGAIGLVVGRYMRVYRLEVPILEVTDTSTLSRSMVDSAQAEAWYLSRLPLVRFLEAVRPI